MNFPNAAYDLASERESQEREAAVKAARATISAQGTGVCVDCERPIPDARRAAAPFATRCIECQTFHEQEKDHR